MNMTQPSVIEPPGTRPAVRKVGVSEPPPPPRPVDASTTTTTNAPMSSGSSQRAQWLVGLLVFIAVLLVGGVALRFWFLH